MSKYKVLKDNLKNVIDEEFEKTLTIITEEYEAKIRRQAAEITRLLAENKRLKDENKKMIFKIDSYELYGNQHEEEYNQAFNQGADKAWELARKITCQPINGGFNRSEFEEMFNEGYISDVFEKYTYPEAATKVAEWEKAKEFERGDVVKSRYCDAYEFCITDIDCNGHIYGIGRYGAIYNDKNPEDWKKTGRHIDIDGFLKQIGGEQE